MKKMDFIAKYKNIEVNYYPDSPVKCSRYQCGFSTNVNNYGYGETTEEAVRDYKKLLLKALDDVNELLEEKEADARSDT